MESEICRIMYVYDCVSLISLFDQLLQNRNAYRDTLDQPVFNIWSFHGSWSRLKFSRAVSHASLNITDVSERISVFMIKFDIWCDHDDRDGDDPWIFGDF